MSNDAKQQLAQALIQSQAVPPPADQANPFILNQALEQAAAPQRAPLHPLVQAIMTHLGLLNMIRNQGNQAVVDPENPIQQ